jgi:hypothetical protein
LILITHSNDFVNLLLAKECDIDHFYQVRRETDHTHHFSSIHRCDASVLQSKGG